MNKIIAIEGICGAGKSTLIEEIVKRGYQLLPELSTELEQFFPKFSIDFSEAISADLWFLNQEVKRCYRAREMSKTGPVIADRWYYSIFSVSYARNKLFGTQDYEPFKLRVDELLKMGSIFKPKLAIVDVPTHVAVDRLSERYGNSQFYETMNILSPPMLDKQREYYKILAKNEGLLLDGIKNPKSLADEVLNWIEKDI